MAEDKTRERSSDLKKLLIDLNKLKDVVEGRTPAVKPAEEKKAAPEPEKKKSDKQVIDKLIKRKNEIKQLLNVLDEEYRESVISEKTYREARNRSKEELIRIQNELEALESGGMKDEKIVRIVDMEKKRIDLENRIKELTESFARAEITQESYSKELNKTKKELDQIKAEIVRLDKGATVPEVRMEEKEKKPEKEQEEKRVIKSKLKEEEKKPEPEAKPEEKEPETQPNEPAKEKEGKDEK
jgi:hypothetical protein